MDCPNCGAHIGRFELDQNCRQCGVNLFYSQQEKLLVEDAKKCELEFASFRILVERLKTAFIRGPLAIARIVLVVAAIGAVFLPFASFKLTLPLIEKSLSFSGYGLISAITGGAFKTLLDFSELELAKDVTTKSFALSATIALVLLAAALLLLTELLTFLNIRKTAKLMCAFSVTGIVFSLASAVCSFLLAGCAGSYLSTSVGAGAFVCVAVFAAMFIDNWLIIKKNIAPVFDELDLKRIETRKKVKRGEISLSDLSLPVFETEEDKAKRLEIEAELLKKEAALSE